MDYPIHIDTLSMELSILCFKGSPYAAFKMKIIIISYLVWVEI